MRYVFVCFIMHTTQYWLLLLFCLANNMDQHFLLSMIRQNLHNSKNNEKKKFVQSPQCETLLLVWCMNNQNNKVINHLNNSVTHAHTSLKVEVPLLPKFVWNFRRKLTENLLKIDGTRKQTIEQAKAQSKHQTSFPSFSSPSETNLLKTHRTWQIHQLMQLPCTPWTKTANCFQVNNCTMLQTRMCVNLRILRANWWQRHSLQVVQTLLWRRWLR